MSKIMLPNYNRSILNLIVSILKYYNVDSKYSGLEEIDKILQNDYKNIVMVILDGMGENIIKQNSPDGLFYKNKLCNITSVYPSTTTAAMTTYYSGKPPIETGWIAWSQYFKEYGKNIDVFPEVDDTTGEPLKIKDMKISDIIGYKPIYSQILEKNDDFMVCEIMPSYVKKKTALTITADTIDEMCKGIENLCQTEKQSFIFAYCDNPDGIIHHTGCYSNETKEFIKETENRFTNLVEKLKGTNTLLLISADHGHHDTKEKISMLDLPEIQECLIMPPSLESRMISFNVKENKKDKFKQDFESRFKDKYKLFTREELLQSHLLGYGKEHRKIDDFLGNFIAIAISDTTIILENYLRREIHGEDKKISTHCGLTQDEMEVPIIMFDLK